MPVSPDCGKSLEQFRSSRVSRQKTEDFTHTRVHLVHDDFKIVVYKYLAYMYFQLKKGEPLDPEKLMNDGDGALAHINPTYWEYIFDSMEELGYIRWPEDVRAAGDPYTPEQLIRCKITPSGIDYLLQIFALEEVRKVVGGVKAFSLSLKPSAVQFRSVCLFRHTSSRTAHRSRRLFLFQSKRCRFFTPSILLSKSKPRFSLRASPTTSALRCAGF